MDGIRSAAPGEAELLSGLAFRSKAHWGYDSSFMRACRGELTYTEAQIAGDRYHFFLAECQGVVVGFYGLDTAGGCEFEMEALFVDPEHMGRGYGKRLFAHAVAAAAELGAECIRIQSDPYAEPFYLAMGAKTTGTRPSGSIAGRVLPLMCYPLEPICG